MKSRLRTKHGGSSQPTDMELLHRELAKLSRRNGRAVVLATGFSSVAHAVVTETSSRETHLMLPRGTLAATTDDRAPYGDFASVHTHEITDAEHLEDCLAKLGPLDAIIDVSSAGGDPVQTWRDTFFHLSPGGVYAVYHPDQRDGGVRDQLAATWRKPLKVRETTTPEELDRQPRRFEWARALRSSTSDDNWSIAIKANKHLLRLDSSSVQLILPEREPMTTARVLQTAAGGSFAARCEVTHHGGFPRPSFPATITYPELRLHDYQGRIAVVRNTLIHTETTILPESFRHYNSRNPANTRVASSKPRFGRTTASEAPAHTLPGVYYHVDSENPGHFGHILSEDVSRLWGWRAAKRAHPDLKLLFRTRNPIEREYKQVPRLEQQLFGAFGVAPNDIVWSEEPVFVEELCAASPMLHNKVPVHVHPEVEDVWDAITEGLTSDVCQQPVRTPTKIFVSRRPSYRRGNRSCRNVDEVESRFRASGFDIVYPEDLDLSEQATVFGRADVIAGFAGSGMYNLIYARQRPRVIVLSQTAYTSRTEHLITAVRGGDVHYFWSEPDVQHPSNGWSREAYFSAWAFDFAHLGRELDAVLDG